MTGPPPAGGCWSTAPAGGLSRSRSRAKAGRGRSVSGQAGRSLPGRAKLVLVPGMDHHFSIYPSLEAAYRADGGFVAPERPVMEIVDWLRKVVRAGS